MKKITYLPVFCLLLLLSACGSNPSFSTYEAETYPNLKLIFDDEFGEDAYYSELQYYRTTSGSILSATGIDNPTEVDEKNEIQLYERELFQGSWNKSAIVTMRIPEGTKPVDFMFQLGKTIDLNILANLVMDAKNRFIQKSKVEEPYIVSINIDTPFIGDVSKTEISVGLAETLDDDVVHYEYSMDGTFKKMRN